MRFSHTNFAVTECSRWYNYSTAEEHERLRVDTSLAMAAEEDMAHDDPPYTTPCLEVISDVQVMICASAYRWDCMVTALCSTDF